MTHDCHQPTACGCRVVPEVTLGACSRDLTFPLFSISQVSHAPGAYYPRHAHERGYVAFVQQGCHQDEVAGKTDLAQSATVVVMPRGLAHSNRIGKRGARALLVSLEPALREIARVPNQWRSLRSGPATRVFLRLCQTLQLPWESERDTIEELVLELLHAVAGTPATPLRGAPRCVRLARAQLRENACGRFRLADVAREAQVDAAYLARAFRRAEGCTMGEYVRRLRACKAAALIAAHRMPLAEVAFTAGFADQSHLSRIFKTEFGVTPLSYQRLVG